MWRSSANGTTRTLFARRRARGETHERPDHDATDGSAGEGGALGPHTQGGEPAQTRGPSLACDLDELFSLEAEERRDGGEIVERERCLVTQTPGEVRLTHSDGVSGRGAIHALGRERCAHFGRDALGEGRL